MYQTVIVEDDPTISLLHRTFLARDNRFTLARAFPNGYEALEWLRHHTADLIILDVYMPRMTGLDLLRALRAEGIGIDAIMVTAANDSKTVDALLKLGVTDYLVKPFAASRFQQALDTFCQHREAVSHDSISQQELDALFPSAVAPAAAAAPAAPIPKGMQARTLDRIRECLHQIPKTGATCETIADCSGFSTVTVRRYLTYLVDQGEAVTLVNYDTGGRPCILYRPLSPLPPLS